MLMPLVEVIARYDLDLHGVIHAGAHEGQEAESYRECGIGDVFWIEANPTTVATLRAHVEPYGHLVAQACLSARTGDEVTFHVAEAPDRSNRGQSSSILPLGTHRDKHPEVAYVDHQPMIATSLDDLCDAHNVGGAGWDMLNMDIQGAEGLVLQGAERILESITLVYFEANVDELYEGCARLADLDVFLVEHGFEIREVLLAGCQRRNCSDGGNRWVGWGDAVAIRCDNPRPFAATHPREASDWYR